MPRVESSKSVNGYYLILGELYHMDEDTHRLRKVRTVSTREAEKIRKKWKLRNDESLVPISKPIIRTNRKTRKKFLVRRSV